MYILIIYFFFFQAEDGIRDTSVTGVQTCALPICAETRCQAVGISRRHLNPAAPVSRGGLDIRDYGLTLGGDVNGVLRRYRRVGYPAATREEQKHKRQVTTFLH